MLRGGALGCFPMRPVSPMSFQVLTRLLCTRTLFMAAIPTIVMETNCCTELNLPVDEWYLNRWTLPDRSAFGHQVGRAPATVV